MVHESWCAVPSHTAAWAWLLTCLHLSSKLMKWSQQPLPTCHRTWYMSVRISGWSLASLRTEARADSYGSLGSTELSPRCFRETQLLTRRLPCQSRTIIDLTAADLSGASLELCSIFHLTCRVKGLSKVHREAQKRGPDRKGSTKCCGACYIVDDTLYAYVVASCAVGECMRWRSRSLLKFSQLLCLMQLSLSKCAREWSCLW